MRNFFPLVFFLFVNLVAAQEDFFQSIEFKNIGPTIMSGRVVDVAVNPENTSEFYVAYASGGLWYTNNNGNSFVPVMDNSPTLNCGTVTVDWKSGIIWVGTGEVNASRSSYSGVGILKSEDKGKTWKNIGLKDSHHISQILVNPNNINEIVVGVAGHLYTPNEERGVFKTSDGGKTWEKSLYINAESGVIDVVAAPNNFKVQYASVWQENRKAWDFRGNGIASAIYKSIDGGIIWKCVTDQTSGFPHNEGVGRIGLASFDENIVYAVVDNQNKRPEVKTEKPSDANRALFQTNVIGCELYKSEDGGKNWKRTHENFLDDLYYSYGYYFGTIAVDEKNSERVYIAGVPLLFSEDGGKKFQKISQENVHSDHHVIWVNPKKSNHIINGNDGGVNITYDNGENWFKCNNQAVGQFYAINVDEQEPYNVYGGMQDNGVWVGPNYYEHNLEWQDEGKYPYEFLVGGDGMQVQIDKRNPNIVITGSQFGNYVRINRAKKTKKEISPRAKKENKPYRYNWQTPILLSSHNQDILYIGSNFLHRSMDQGDTWEIISPDLTQGAKEGNVAFGTITTISESPLQFGLLYTGSDDGLIYVSKDAGATWIKISNSQTSGLPQNFWVSRVVASSHKKERVYVTLNGYRNDDFTPMVFVSEDYGQNWKNIGKSLPASPVNVILEDPKNENLLFVGTDNNLFVSIDKGSTWQEFSNGIPNVAVHDLVIQKKENDLVVGTHGRSIYKANVSNIQKLNSEVLEKELYIYDSKPIVKEDFWGNRRNAWAKPFEPKIEFWFYSNAQKEVQIEIINPIGQKVYQKTITAKKGLNKIEYDLTLSQETIDKWKTKEPKLEFKIAKNSKVYLPASKYKLKLIDNKKIVEKEFAIEESKK